MTPRIRHILSFCLLCIFILYIIPKEIYHGFMHHHDTVHVHLNVKNGLQIDKEHHHCELLKYEQEQQFISYSLLCFTAKSIGIYFSKTISTYSTPFLPANNASITALRGPPVFS